MRDLGSGATGAQPAEGTTACDLPPSATTDAPRMDPINRQVKQIIGQQAARAYGLRIHHDHQADER